MILTEYLISAHQAIILLNESRLCSIADLCSTQNYGCHLRNREDAVALQRAKQLMSDLLSGVQPVLADSRLTERAASRAALTQRWSLRAWLDHFFGFSNRTRGECSSGGATRLRNAAPLLAYPHPMLAVASGGGTGGTGTKGAIGGGHGLYHNP